MLDTTQIQTNSSLNQDESSSQKHSIWEIVFEHQNKPSQKLTLDSEALEVEVETSPRSNLSLSQKQKQSNLLNQNSYTEKSLKKQLRDEFDNNELVAASWGLKAFVVKELVRLATSSEWLDDDKMRMKAISEIAKIAGFKDNPKITIIQNQIPEMQEKDIYYK